LVAGKFITELASAPAMVSEAIDLVATGVGKVAKGLMLSAMSEAIITADPANYDKHMREAVKALNGKNPEVNKVAREMVATAASGAASVAKVMLLSAMSEGIATADPYHYDERMKEAQKALNGENPEFNQVMREMFVDPVRRTNQAITDLDKYTQKKYYTVPGIVRKGMIGTAEIGLVFAGPAVRGGATLVQKATTSTGQVVKRAFTFNSSKAAKTVSQHFQNEVARNKPFLHRFDYSHDYLQAKREFITAKEFEGILSKDLLVVRYHNSTGTHKWFMPISEGNKHWTVNEIKDALAKLDKFGEVTHVSVARIPAGEPVRFLHGRAKQQIDVLSNETRPGGGVQYRFFDFDPRWIKETREIPGVKHPRK
jgi:hypothetical protein